MPDPVDHGWLKQGSTSSAEVRQSYEDWAGSYDNDLLDWDYRAPLESASLLKSSIPVSSTILDAGCGTGLVGAALKQVGCAQKSVTRPASRPADKKTPPQPAALNFIFDRFLQVL